MKTILTVATCLVFVAVENVHGYACTTACLHKKKNCFKLPWSSQRVCLKGHPYATVCYKACNVHRQPVPNVAGYDNTNSGGQSYGGGQSHGGVQSYGGGQSHGGDAWGHWSNWGNHRGSMDPNSPHSGGAGVRGRMSGGGGWGDNTHSGGQPYRGGQSHGQIQAYEGAGFQLHRGGPNYGGVAWGHWSNWENDRGSKDPNSPHSGGTGGLGRMSGGGGGGDSVNGGWTTFSAWSKLEECPATCGQGAIAFFRIRRCTNPKPSNMGQQCVGTPTEFAAKRCATLDCGVDGGWGDYTSWTLLSNCSKTCGGGIAAFRRYRSCNNPRPRSSGKPCEGNSTIYSAQVCSTEECPVDGVWSDFSEWATVGGCTVTCGGATVRNVRFRTCTNPEPSRGGKPCPGKAAHFANKLCAEAECDGSGWTVGSEWEMVDECPVFCGGGSASHVRTRNCTLPAAADGSLGCAGEAKQYSDITCNDKDCEDNCEGEMPVFIVHPKDTTAYYQCSADGQIADLRHCSGDSTWNSMKKACSP